MTDNFTTLIINIMNLMVDSQKMKCVELSLAADLFHSFVTEKYQPCSTRSYFHHNTTAETSIWCSTYNLGHQLSDMTR